MKKWLIVHEQASYDTNPKMIGFDYEKANSIQPDDYVIYYLKGGKVKGLYKVAEKPWGRESSWTSKIQIKLEPLKVLTEGVDFKPLVAVLKLFENHRKNWGAQLQGPNNIKEISDYDFAIINNLIDEMSFQEEVDSSKAENDTARKQRLAVANKIPESHLTSVVSYKRNPDVVAEVLKRANGICEECGKEAPFLRSKDNSPYLEVHHKIQLSKGGEDTVQNAIAVCPNCHRKLHYG